MGEPKVEEAIIIHRLKKTSLNRRDFLMGSAALAISAGAASLAPLALLAGCAAPFPPPQSDTWLILGQRVDSTVRLPSGRPAADGLYSLAFDAQGGGFMETLTINNTLWAQTLLVDPDNHVLYACDKRVDNPDFADIGGGGDLYSYQFERDGLAVKLDSDLSYGANPSALALSADGGFLVTAIAGGGGTATVVKANEQGILEIGFVYSECSLVLRQVERDGSAGKVIDRYLLNPDGAPSAPSDVKLAPSGAFFLLCDRDANTLYTFVPHPETGELALTSDPFVEPDGSRGSRCVFHPKGPWTYVSSADLPHLLALVYDENGGLTQMQNVAPIERPEMYEARPEGYLYEQSFLCIDTSGRFVYCGARLSKGLNSEYELVAVFAVDEQSGWLTPVHYYFLENAQGASDAAISPDGAWLIVACRHSCELLVLKIAADGRLELHNRHPVPTPVSVCWYQRG